jgi:hypothetical protein
MTASDSNNQAFLDVVFAADRSSFTIPKLKWRELIFIRALRPQGGSWVRDPSRFMPAFAAGDLLPEGQCYSVVDEGERVRISPSPSTST